MMARKKYEKSLASNFHHQIKSFNLHLTIPTNQKQKSNSEGNDVVVVSTFFSYYSLDRCCCKMCVLNSRFLEVAHISFLHRNPQSYLLKTTTKSERARYLLSINRTKNAKSIMYTVKNQKIFDSRSRL